MEKVLNLFVSGRRFLVSLETKKQDNDKVDTYRIEVPVFMFHYLEIKFVNLFLGCTLLCTVIAFTIDRFSSVEVSKGI